LGHCSAPTHLKHPAGKKNLQLRFGPQLRQPKDSFGLASDLMVSTEPFFSSWGLASPLPPFPPFPPLGRWVCDGPFWGPRPDHATAWISMYKVFTRQTHTNSCLCKNYKNTAKMQRSSWCQCQAFCLPFRTSLDPECPKIAKSSSQLKDLKDMMVFFEPYEEFECLNNVLVPKSYPSYHPNQGTHSDSVLPIPKCQVQNHPVTFPSRRNLHHLSTPLLQLCPFPCHPWTGDDYG